MYHACISMPRHFVLPNYPGVRRESGPDLELETQTAAAGWSRAAARTATRSDCQDQG